MANTFDLEEQEQLDQIKHFWREYGNLISWALIVVFGAIAAWNGWNWWQTRQAGQASMMYDEVERAAVGGDVERVERAFSDMKARFGRTTYAQQAGLLAAAALYDKGKVDLAKADLAWVADNASDEGYQAVARLRLASILMDAKQYDAALKQVDASFPREFQALADDRRGDIYNLQGKKAEAKAQYEKAWQGLDDRSDARKLVEVKLAALGVDARHLSAAPAAGAKS